MRNTSRFYLCSFVVALVLTGIIGVISTKWSPIGTLLFPGMLIAAIIFPEGINSSGGNLYLVAAGLVESALLAFPLMWLWKLIDLPRPIQAANI